MLEKMAKERAAYAIVREHDRHLEALISSAKAELGLWSELGLGEGRQLFWKSFQAGKVRPCMSHGPLPLRCRKLFMLTMVPSL